MKGRKVPPRPEVAEVVRKAEPLTMDDLIAALDTHVERVYMGRPITPAHMPEPTPYERGFLDRFQDRKRRP